MQKSNKASLQAMYKGVMQKQSFDEEDFSGEMLPETQDIDMKIDFSQDLNALVESEATLSDEFKEKTSIIFEAAVKSKLSEEVSRLEEQYKEELAEEVSSIKS